MRFQLRAGLRGAALLGVLLAGCTGLLHSTARPEQTYYLRAAAAAGAAAASTDGAPAAAAPASTAAVAGRGVSLRVGAPLASPGLDTSHIMLLQPDHRMNFYAVSRWPGAAPELIGALAVETLRASGTWSSVEDSVSPFPADYLLQLTLRRFEADYTGGGAAPQVQVRLECTIGRREGREVLATFVAQGTATAAADRMGEVVAAFEQATRAALQSLSQQSGEAVRAHAR